MTSILLSPEMICTQMMKRIPYNITPFNVTWELGHKVSKSPVKCGSQLHILGSILYVYAEEEAERGKRRRP
ncbi:hypothetical protein VNO78_10811 [Psophocarpus tetragonolobus]|uniref:Uncharacterized protein n=1 Tax=Psophocarpus tetragonolobus TaxID=3891 RepID=A0AAN9XN31_PSOTE